MSIRTLLVLGTATVFAVGALVWLAVVLMNRPADPEVTQKERESLSNEEKADVMRELQQMASHRERTTEPLPEEQKIEVLAQLEEQKQQPGTKADASVQTTPDTGSSAAPSAKKSTLSDEDKARILEDLSRAE